MERSIVGAAAAILLAFVLSFLSVYFLASRLLDVGEHV